MLLVPGDGDLERTEIRMAFLEPRPKLAEQRLVVGYEGVGAAAEKAAYEAKAAGPEVQGDGIVVNPHQTRSSTAGVFSTPLLQNFFTGPTIYPI